MRLICTKSNVGHWAAAYIQQAVNSVAPTTKKPFVLGLPTGQTVLAMYEKLCSLSYQKALNFKHVITFNMDEYVGLPPAHPQSYHAFMHRNFFDLLPAPPAHTFLPNGQAADLPTECARYEQAISHVGGMNLLVGGIGRNGHIAFNEPDTPFDSRTHVADLSASTRQANARFFGGEINQVPHQAITMGIGTILKAHELLFLATGAAKANAVAHLIADLPTVQWPLTALKLHPRATLVVDMELVAALAESVQQFLLAKSKQQPNHLAWSVEIQ